MTIPYPFADAIATVRDGTHLYPFGRNDGDTLAEAVVIAEAVGDLKWRAYTPSWSAFIPFGYRGGPGGTWSNCRSLKACAERLAAVRGGGREH